MGTIRENFIEIGPNREANFERAAEERLEQIRAAEAFLVTGHPGVQPPPPYGKEWNRDYNPNPYPEAAPDAEMYGHTGIGFLYGQGDERKMGFGRFAVEMAGWNLVREGVEVFEAETKVDKKELIPPFPYDKVEKREKR